MARVASAFYDPSWLESIRIMQQKVEEIYNPTWLKQMETIQRQLSGSLEAFQTIQPAVLKSASILSQALCTPWADAPKSALDYSPLLDYIRQEQSLIASIAPFSELQSALSDHLLAWSSMTDSLQINSLASQKEYAVAQVCTLADNISSTIDENQVEHSTELSAEDKQIISNEVTEILASEKNWEQRLMESVIRLKSTHPVLATILDKIILAILINIAATIIATSIGQARSPANVYDKPRTTSPVVYRLKPLQQVVIIGEEPYYYQIEIKDNDTQETLVGFVSKRSLQEVDTQEGTFDVQGQN